MKKFIVVIVVLFGAFITYAQQPANKSPQNKTETAKTKYTCPMHPEVISDKPGKCPKCGMDLMRSKKEQMKMEVMKMYTCPMHPDVVSNKPGNCPKCGMKLIEKKKASGKNEKMKM